MGVGVAVAMDGTLGRSAGTFAGCRPSLRPHGSEPDEAFYAFERKVVHIEIGAIEALREAYGEILPPERRVLDLMSSWRSHLPYSGLGEVTGSGMNAAEMADNPQLDSCARPQPEPRAPCCRSPTRSFDAVVCAVSVQYLIAPVDGVRRRAPGARPGRTVRGVVLEPVLPDESGRDLARQRRRGPPLPGQGLPRAGRVRWTSSTSGGRAPTIRCTWSGARVDCPLAPSDLRSARIRPPATDRGGTSMKAAVLTSIPGELSDRGRRDRQAAARRGADPHGGRRAVPQRPPLHGGQVPLPDAHRARATSRPASSRRSARTSPTCSPATTSSPACRCSAATATTASPAARTSAAARTWWRRGFDGAPRLSLNGQPVVPVPRPVVVRRADARAPERGREDPQGHAARPGRAHRLRRHDRCRRGVQHRAGASRAARSRSSAAAASASTACRAPRSPAPSASSPSTWCRSKLELAEQFGATDLVDASKGDAVAAGAGAHRRRRRLLVRGHRPEGDDRAGVGRC